METRLPPLVKGLLSFVVPALRSAHHRRLAATGSPEYCYSVFLRHFAHLARYNGARMPRTVAEFGPGDSLGTGLAALIAGADRYIALDVQNHTDPAQDLRVFDQLVALFRNRTPIPDAGVRIATEPPDWAFPQPLAAGLHHALGPERLQAIRDDLATRSGRFVRFAVPWYGHPAIEARSIDWLLSHSVMEHVDDVGHAYACCADWIADAGHMTHEVDYSSHGLTRRWNGHWTIGSMKWRMIRGVRPFLINRLPHEAQLGILRRNGFRILHERLVSRDDGIARQRFDAPYASMSDDSARTHIGFIVCGKLSQGVPAIP